MSEELIDTFWPGLLSPFESPFSPTLREQQLQILSHIKTLRRQLDKAQDELDLITSQINALERAMEKK